MINFMINCKCRSARHVPIFIAVPESPEIQPEPVTYVTAISVNLTWKSGFNGGSKQKFTVQYRKVGDPAFICDGEIGHDPGYQRLAHKFVSNLTEKTQYEFRVKAHNELGSSNPYDKMFTTKGNY